MRRSPHRLLHACAGLVAFAFAACSSDPFEAGPPIESPGPRLVYVAVGASETVGIGSEEPLREAWPQVLYRTALPRSATLINLGVPGSTVEEALEQQAPEAVRLQPDLVTVWLNVNDIIAGVSPEEYEPNLEALVSTLRRGGDTQLFVANTPPLDRLPAYVRCLPYVPGGDGLCDTNRLAPSRGRIEAVVARYNAAIRAVASRNGATVVDLHAVAMKARAAGTEGELISDDGFHPSTAGHAAVARAFAGAVRAAGIRP